MCKCNSVSFILSKIHPKTLYNMETTQHFTFNRKAIPKPQSFTPSCKLSNPIPVTNINRGSKRFSILELTFLILNRLLFFDNFLRKVRTPSCPTPFTMATDASPAFQTVTQPHDFRPEISASPSSAHDGLEFWQFMIAGSIAGLVEHMAMFPVDTLKTRMQIFGGSCSVQPIGVRQALGSILKLEGPAGLYRGIGAMGLGAGPAHAVYFSVYEIFKEYFSRGNPNSPVAHAVSGVFATVASDAVITPMDVVKQRLQLQSSPYKGVADCVRRVLVEEGVGAFYKSYRTTVVMNAPFTAVHFATYEAAKRGLMEVSPESASDERLVVHATAGAAAGALAAAVTTPLDVVKTQLQCQGVCGCDRFSSNSIGDVIRSLVMKDGYRSLMRGWIPRMLFHAPAAAICWSTYEASKTFFQELNGSDSSRN